MSDNKNAGLQFKVQYLILKDLNGLAPGDLKEHLLLYKVLFGPYAVGKPGKGPPFWWCSFWNALPKERHITWHWGDNESLFIKGNCFIAEGSRVARGVLNLPSLHIVVPIKKVP